MIQGLRSAAAALLFCLLAWPAAAQSPGPQGSESGEHREQEWRIPAAGGQQLMLTTVMRPPGEARAPLAIINHGSPDAATRPKMPRQRYSRMAAFLVERGYVVAVPLRRGYGATGGPWAEAYGGCANPDFYRAGLEAAADIKAALDYMRTQPFVAPDRTIIVGQSAGGWGTIALSSQNPPGVTGMVNFAGGRGGHAKLPGGGIGNCEPSALVRAAGKYGSTARVPMVWLYTANDSYFEPALARRMADAYNGTGGRADFRALGPDGKDGHNLLTSATGSAVWQPIVADFLRGK
jgi:dienelactone hydrolase